MATSALVPLSEYLATSYRPDCDWVDGEIKERNKGDGPHSYLQTFFAKYFGARESQLGVEFSASVGCRFPLRASEFPM